MNSIFLSFPLTGDRDYGIFIIIGCQASTGGFILKYLTIIQARFNRYGLGRAYFRANGISHIPAAIAFDSHLIDRRGIDDPKRTDHHTHPASNTCGFVNINQSRFRISPHGSIGARIQARRFDAMPALQGKILTLHIHPGNRLWFFRNRGDKLFGNRCDFGSAPQFTLVASRTFFGVYFQNLQFILL
jgi:hypothetical protein